MTPDGRAQALQRQHVLQQLCDLALNHLWLEEEPRRLGSCREGLAAPDGSAHGPELTFWTLGAWRVRGRSGPGSL